MDLMHEATLVQVDPSQPFEPEATQRHHDLLAHPETPASLRDWAAGVIQRDERRLRDWRRMRPRFEKLPAAYQAMFSTVRDEYAALADAQEQAVVDNIEKSMKAALRQAKDDHDKRVAEIRD